MKAPKCPKCGKEHYSTQRCSADESAGRGKRSDQPSQPVGNDTAKASGVVPDSARWETPRSPLKSVRPADTEVHRESSSGDQDAPVSGEGRRREALAQGADNVVERRSIEPAALDTTPIEAGVAPGPLTPAEKQKAYRERLRADPVKWLEHLESERLRKANKLRMRKKRDGR